MCVHVCTWIMEEVADHSETYHCSMGSVVPLVFCSLCPTLLRAGTSVSVAKHDNTHVKKFSLINLIWLLILSNTSCIYKLEDYVYVQYHLTIRSSRLCL